MARVSASRPPFEAAYAAMFADVWIACTDETFTTAPPFFCSNGYANLTPKNAERKFEAMTVSHSSTVVSIKGLATCIAALFTSTSSDSVNALACSKIICISSGREISARMNKPLAGKPSPKSLRSTAMTCQPLAANRLNVARPMPPAAPVMRTVFASITRPLSIVTSQTRPIKCGECPNPHYRSPNHPTDS